MRGMICREPEGSSGEGRGDPSIQLLEVVWSGKPEGVADGEPERVVCISRAVGDVKPMASQCGSQCISTARM